jgi:ribose transport system ATP-binding protein
MPSSRSIRTPLPPTEAPAPPDAAKLLAVSGIRKRYGGVQALRGIDLHVGAGEVLGLVGANGAGKSTLIRILAGVEQPDEGRIMLDGRIVAFSDPAAAFAHRLSFLHQELNLVGTMTVLQNLGLGLARASRLGLFARGRLRLAAVPVLRRLGLDVALDRKLSSLSPAQQWLVAIAHALLHEARLIVMDEPTASLSGREAQTLMRIVQELAGQGVAVIYVSHRLDEILALCARVVAFRDGAVAGTFTRATLSRDGLVAAIVGHPVAPAPPAPAAAARGRPVLTVSGLARPPMVRDVGFTLHGGEVLGLAGLVGAGRSETARLIFGADRPLRGDLTLDGKPFSPRSPADAVAAGIALVPEERRSEGLILGKSVAFNATLAVLDSLAPSRLLPLISPRARRTRAEALGRQLMLRAASVEMPVGRLSGGNQQKVVLAKWLAARPRVLILDEPTRGVDVGARAEIHRIIRGLAAEGMAVLVISSEPDELPDLADRVLVMVEGRIAGSLTGAEITRADIVAASYRESRMESPS